MTEPGTEESTRAEVEEILDAIYGGYLAGATNSIDVHLSERVTMFDSAAPDLVDGLADLARLRAARAEHADADSGNVETALTVHQLATRRLSDLVVATWWLRVDGTDASGEPVLPELSRNSAVFEPSPGGLVIAHLHEDVWQPLGGPLADRAPGLSGA
ncbi:hypothetical protein [Agromyces italicus]|uniref:hypothetical protein n=1 Tax=Agromyces italicus TaxID=279572 RepID=UPI0003B59525|nr:hypothetical protein [Agromyces italicus]